MCIVAIYIYIYIKPLVLFIFLLKTVQLEIKFSEDFDDLSLLVLCLVLEYLARVFVAIECKLLSLTFLLRWTIREFYSRDQDNSSSQIYLIVKQNNISLSPVTLSVVRT